MAATAVTPFEVTSAGDSDTSDGDYTTIPADGIIFPNDARTFVLLVATGGVSTMAVAAPAATFRSGFGDITIPALSLALNSAGAQRGIVHVPIAYNVDGKVTITESGAGAMAARVCRLANYS